MSTLSLELLRSKRSPDAAKWHGKMQKIAQRLILKHGTPSLGNFRNPVKEIFYIVLSAKTTERLYREANRVLWVRFGDLNGISKATVPEIRRCVASAGLGTKRAHQIKAIASRLYFDFGKFPAKKLRALSAQEVYEYLLSLPGVGPKSALCVMMYSLEFDVFPVDVHVRRVLHRIGLVRNTLKHYEAQKQLPAFVPNGTSKSLHVTLLLHGRRICTPRNPDCKNCPIIDFCNVGRQREKTIERPGQASTSLKAGK